MQPVSPGSSTSQSHCIQFGVPLPLVLGRYQEGLIPNIVRDMIHFLCLCVEVKGLFSVQPNAKAIGALYKRVNGLPNKFEFELEETHTVANLFILYLQEIPGGLIPAPFVPCLIDAAYSNFQSVDELRRCITKFPLTENKRLFEAILIFLNYVASKSAVNSMEMSELSQIFGPVCLRFYPEDQANKVARSHAFEQILIHHKSLFREFPREWTLKRSLPPPALHLQRLSTLHQRDHVKIALDELQKSIQNLHKTLQQCTNETDIQQISANLSKAVTEFQSYQKILDPKVPPTYTPTNLKSLVDVASGHHSIQGRRPTMEDAVIHMDNFNQASPLLSSEKGRAIWAVYDGHGGDEVSLLAGEMLHKEIVYSLAKHRGRDVASCLVDAIKKTDKYLCQKSLQNNYKSGSTMVLLLLVDETLYVANLGDSEAVLGQLSADQTYKAFLLSYPHKPAAIEERMRIEALGGVVSPTGRLFGQLAVSRSLGDVHMKKPRLTENFVSNDPYIAKYELNKGDDFIVLACDGLWDVMSYQQAVDIIAKVKKKGLDAEQVAKLLVEKAFLDGSTDNISAIVIYLKWHLITEDPSSFATTSYAGSKVLTQTL